jgi:hypothetical protein
VIVRFVLWSLVDTATSVAELRDSIRDEAAAAFGDVPGPLLRAWVSDDSSERWGAFYVFDSAEAAEQQLPSRVRELIGKDPELVEDFDLEATVSVAPQLARLGLAFE